MPFGLELGRLFGGGKPTEALKEAPPVQITDSQPGRMHGATITPSRFGMRISRDAEGVEGKRPACELRIAEEGSEDRAFTVSEGFSFNVGGKKVIVTGISTDSALETMQDGKVIPAKTPYVELNTVNPLR